MYEVQNMKTIQLEDREIELLEGILSDGGSFEMLEEWHEENDGEIYGFTNINEVEALLTSIDSKLSS